MAMYTAGSTEYSAVQATLAFCGSNDILCIPAGSSIWASKLYVTINGLIILGSGMGQTILTSNYLNLNEGLIQICPSDPTLNPAFRVSGIEFIGDWKSSGIWIEQPSSSHTINNSIRVDHCKFYKCRTDSVHLNGQYYGLIDHCLFISPYKAIGVEGNVSNPWFPWEDMTTEVGNEKQFFIEDCIFEGEPGQTYTSALIMAGSGGRFVFRHNSVDNWQDSDILDMHGNEDSLNPVNDPGGNRGTRCAEIYDNVFTGTSDVYSGYRLMYQRGGTLIMFNNAYTGAESSCNIQMTGENQSLWGSPYGNDNVINTYFWNNTFNGNPIIPSRQTELDESYIIENTHYWLSAKPSYDPYTYPHPMAVDLKYMMVLK